MRHAYVPHSKTQRVLRQFYDRHRLSGLVKTMAQKIELLDEDNRQLRAAVTIYREVIRRTNDHDRTVGQ